MAFALALLALDARAADVPLFRIFLKDGAALVSYGEFARVAGRVVFSVPIGDPSAEEVRLQVVGIPEASVDWSRTEAYADAVRAKRYADTRGESDFAILTGHVTSALNQIDAERDPARRLAMALEARRNLAAWPAANYGYKAAEVADLLILFDDAIARLRGAAGGNAFDLSLVAMTLPPPPVELLPAPDAKSTYELAYSAALLAPDPGERVALLKALGEAVPRTPAEAWGAALKGRIDATLAAETRVDRAYQDLIATSIKSAQARAARGDVRGLQDIIARALKTDEKLGAKRAGEMTSLLASLDAHLDEARRVRLARDAWRLRLEAIREYRDAIEDPLERLAGFRKWLDAIRDLAGPDPRFLRPLKERASAGESELRAVTAPAEVQTVHALLAAAFQLVRQAADLRLRAVSSNDMATAWDASAAAAGALSLVDRARDELQRLLSPEPR